MDKRRSPSKAEDEQINSHNYSYVFLPSLRSDMSILVTYPSERHTYSSKSLAIGSKFAKLSFYLRGFGNHSNTAYKVLVLCASL